MSSKRTFSWFGQTTLSVVTATVMLVQIVLPATAFADARTEARRHFRHGMELVVQGQTDAGVAELQQAYDILPHPNVLYNIGRAYAEAGRYEEALDYFEQYLASDPPDREEVRGIVNAINTRMAAREATAAEQRAEAQAQQTPAEGTQTTAPTGPTLRASASEIQALRDAATQIATLGEVSQSDTLRQRAVRLGELADQLEQQNTATTDDDDCDPDRCRPRRTARTARRRKPDSPRTKARSPSRAGFGHGSSGRRRVRRNGRHVLALRAVAPRRRVVDDDHHASGHPPVRPHADRRAPPPRRRRAGHQHDRRRHRRRHPRLQPTPLAASRHAHQRSVDLPRRARHHALGRPADRRRRHRANRGHPRSRFRALRRQRLQRCRQHHHARPRRAPVERARDRRRQRRPGSYARGLEWSHRQQPHVPHQRWLPAARAVLAAVLAGPRRHLLPDGCRSEVGREEHPRPR